MLFLIIPLRVYVVLTEKVYKLSLFFIPLYRDDYIKANF